MGDLFFELGYPFIDVGSGGSVQGLVAGVKYVLDAVPEDCHVIPGHGDATDVAGLREYLTMLETIVRRVDEGMHAGKTAQELVDAGVTREFDARWGQFNFVPPARFVEAIVQSLAE
jgi:glyoxylase-like metal-dependent hydrolase (beta-lactamase superfamily II)